eukprot:gnl/TRDRNA2_/TRDRNA2_179292_c0_seq1.p1 gnl/TRDRNA2_/TRDRNA2_179292_c0~~gnl/TRDRNA2_/TRDRNA2_179292_c0_seq1.p1  ORF type:complete len:339 (+),score=62.98 gnl/TRDRNA2_/TRDRNA2_179292_c0_seq1:129-1019(+)
MAPDARYHIKVYGKHHDPLFQMYKVAAEHLASSRNDVDATVEGFFEAQYEQQLRYMINKYGSAFHQSKPSSPLIFAETDDDKILYFLNEKRFLDWANKRFKYEDHTNAILYKHVGNKALAATKADTGRSYCALSFTLGEDAPEIVHFELFDEECPVLCKNFLDLLELPKFNGNPVHRVKAGAFIQAGDLVDGSGMNSAPAKGKELLRHESFNIKHDRPGLLGMSNHGKDTNGSQFYITIRELPFLDGKSVIIGRVISGMRTIHRISKAPTRNERPVQEVKVNAMLEHRQVGSVQPK